ncbi:hypothetical protein INR49_009206 [Caranx melampygus]|nr:hypothetical protein INR49_009206 [Caranx melampygus]
MPLEEKGATGDSTLPRYNDICLEKYSPTSWSIKASSGNEEEQCSTRLTQPFECSEAKPPRIRCTF